MHRIILTFIFLLFPAFAAEVVLLKQIQVPGSFLKMDKSGLEFGGDIRVGDLNGDGSLDFLVYRSKGNYHDSGGMKPCFLGAFDIHGKELWQAGSGGSQPSRPGPIVLYD